MDIVEEVEHGETARIELAGQLAPGDVAQAARRLQGKVNRTPVLRFPELDRIAGVPVFVKAESLQKGGSFKIRGAMNMLLSQNSSPQRVVAYSSGNHAIGVAIACNTLGAQATLVVPQDVPSVKRRSIEAEGGRIVTYRRDVDDRCAMAEQLALQENAVLVPSFDDPNVIAGQGTVTLELIEAIKESGNVPARILVPCGGGGLVAGACLAVAQSQSDTMVTAVEPEGFDRIGRSLRAGKAIVNPVANDASSLCDALLSRLPSKILLGMASWASVESVTMDDDSITNAVRFAYEHMKLILEPSGAIGLAALLSGSMPVADGAVGLICSGGNVDLANFLRCMENSKGSYSV